MGDGSASATTCSVALNREQTDDEDEVDEAEDDNADDDDVDEVLKSRH